MPARRNHDQTKWIGRFNREVLASLRACKGRNRPTWQHLVYGLTAFNNGSTPSAAAKRYLATTRYGRQACARKAR